MTNTHLRCLNGVRLAEFCGGDVEQVCKTLCCWATLSLKVAINLSWLNDEQPFFNLLTQQRVLD